MSAKWTQKERNAATWDAGKLCAAQTGTVEQRLVETTIELACQRNALLEALKFALPAVECAHRDATLSKNTPSEWWQWHEELEEARAAIDKAESK